MLYEEVLNHVTKMIQADLMESRDEGEDMPNITRDDIHEAIQEYCQDIYTDEQETERDLIKQFGLARAMKMYIKRYNECPINPSAVLYMILEESLEERLLDGEEE